MIILCFSGGMINKNGHLNKKGVIVFFCFPIRLASVMEFVRLKRNKTIGMREPGNMRPRYVLRFLGQQLT